jgi:hypothetical protein
MAPGTGLPRGLVSVRFGRFPVGGKNEFYQQPVLFYHAELMAVLTHDIPVPRKLPRSIRLFHEMTAAAKFRIFLNIIIVSVGENDSENGNDKHQGNDDDFVPRA